VTDFRDIADDFRSRLIEKLAELINPSTSFKPTKETDHCKYCDYKLLCGK